MEHTAELPFTLEQVAVKSGWKPKADPSHNESPGHQNGNNGETAAKMLFPELPELPSIEETMAQAAELKAAREKVAAFTGNAVKKIADAVRYIASANKLQGDEESELALPHVKICKKMIEDLLAHKDPVIYQAASGAFAIATVNCCEAKKEAVESIAAELRERGILKEGTGTVTVDLWGKPHRILLGGGNAGKMRNAMIDLIKKADKAHAKHREERVNAMLKQGPLKPSDLLTGKTGMSVFWIPGKTTSGENRPSGWILVELHVDRGQKVLHIVDAEGGLKKHADKIMARGITLKHASLSWEVFTIRFSDKEKEGMLHAFHDWFRRGLANELNERAKKLKVDIDMP